MKKLKITVNETTYSVIVEEVKETTLQAVEPHHVSRPVINRPSILPLQTKQAPTTNAGANVVTAPMPGVILAVKVKEGDTVKMGDVVVVLEAMKMENEISARKGGTIKEIKVKKGQSVSSGEILVEIE